MILKANVKIPWTLSFASFLVTTGTLLLFFIPSIVDYAANKFLSLATEKTFSLWQRNPLPLYLEAYLFNWTNPEDIYKPGVKPKFTELGPFVFDEIKEKVNITWNSNNTITFKQMRRWYFNEEKSYASLSTNITTINALAVTASYILQDWFYFARKGFDFTLKAQAATLHKTATVGDLLFYGYDDPLITLAKAIPIVNDKIPDIEKFAWFAGRNASYEYDGAVNMVYSGEGFGDIKQWNYAEYGPYSDGECNMVKGSSGEFFAPKRKRDQIGFFSTDICRYVALDYVNDENVAGINGYKYVLAESFFDNGTKTPENICYCGNNCPPYGTVNVSTCKFGAPAFASQPHFYGADPYYLNQIEGLNPIKEKHEMFMVLEPTTGVPLHGEARLQLNLLISPVDSISILEGVPTFYFPVLWFEQKATLPPWIMTLLNLFLHAPLILTIVGATILVIAIPWLLYLVYRPILEKLCWETNKTRARYVHYKLSTSEPKEYELPLIKPLDEEVLLEYNG